MTSQGRRTLGGVVVALSLAVTGAPAWAQAPTTPAPVPEKPFVVPPPFHQGGSGANRTTTTRNCLIGGAVAAAGVFAYGYFEIPVVAATGVAAMSAAAPLLVPGAILAFTGGCIVGAWLSE